MPSLKIEKLRPYFQFLSFWAISDKKRFGRKIGFTTRVMVNEKSKKIHFCRLVWTLGLLRPGPMHARNHDFPTIAV